MNKLLPSAYGIMRDMTPRQAYTFARDIREARKAMGIDFQDDQLTRAVRYCVARHDECHPDPLARPLTKGWRSVLDHDGIDASGKDFRLLPEDPDDPWTDDEITEYVHDSEVYCGPSRYDFDCTGEKLTWGWHYTRTPAGIAIIHEWFYNT